MPTVAGQEKTADGLKVCLLFSRFLRFFDANYYNLGDKWAYSFDVVHDIPTLIERRGGKIQFVRSLDEHFDGGHNDHSNEVSQSHDLALSVSHSDGYL